MRRALFTLTMILGLLIPPLIVAGAQPVQNSQTFTSATTGIEFDLGPSGDISFLPGDYEIRDTPPVVGEYVWFTYNGSNFQVLLIGGSNDTLSSHDATMQNMIDGYDSWTLIAEEIDVEYSWFIGEAEIGGELIVVLYSFELNAFGDTDLMVMQFAVPETLQGDLEFIQAEVTIGGLALLPHIDAGAVAVVAGVDLASDQQSSGQTQSEQASAGDWEALGLISNEEWQSPSHGTHIGWDAAEWAFPAQYGLAIVIEGDPPYDILALELVDETGYAFLTIDMIFDNDNPDTLLDIWTSDDYIASIPNGAVLRASVITDSSVMIVFETATSAGEKRVVVQEATYYDNGTVIISQLWGTPSTIHLVYGKYLDGISVDGQPVVAVWTVEELVTVLGG